MLQTILRRGASSLTRTVPAARTAHSISGHFSFNYGQSSRLPKGAGTLINPDIHEQRSVFTKGNHFCHVGTGVLVLFMLS